MKIQNQSSAQRVVAAMFAKTVVAEYGISLAQSKKYHKRICFTILKHMLVCIRALLNCVSSKRNSFIFLSFLTLLVFLPHPSKAQSAPDPPHIIIGEAFFLETRFAEYFKTHASNINQALSKGDPSLDATVSTTGNLIGAFRGMSMNYRACHLVDDTHLETPQGGIRTYADYAQRSPIPRRSDGKFVTLRNSPPLVNAGIQPLYRKFTFFHFDGEFITMEDLVIGTLQGRNFGWLPSEENIALAHVARIVREDDGSCQLLDELKGHNYSKILTGTDPTLPMEIRLDNKYRINVASATDQQIMDAVAKLIAEYIMDLTFSQNDNGYNSSPYDVFLRKNNLPTAPQNNELTIEYGRQLLATIQATKDFKYVDGDSSFDTHDQKLVFGPTELSGLKIFLTEPGKASLTSGIGNCIACHQPPDFSDFLFHNTGVSQEEYDAIHGDGEFLKISIPEYQKRQKNFRRYLPRKAQHPAGGSPFAEIPSLDETGQTDLGLWNVFLNPAFPKPQKQIEQVLRIQYPDLSSPKDLLLKTVAAFKTPGLRDLGHSNPYMHTGRLGSIESVVRFYNRISKAARSNKVRNPDNEIRRIYLGREDIVSLSAFLRSLNEDYD